MPPLEMRTSSFLTELFDLNIVTLNTRTLDRIDQLPELTVSAAEHNIDTVCVQKYRYHHSKEEIKYHYTGNGWVFVSASARKNSVVIGGVGMLLSHCALKSLNSIEKIQPRIIVATFNSSPSTKIISCYSPTNASDETDLIIFYNELSSLVLIIPKHNVISRDMKAQIGKDKNNIFCLHNSPNRNGEHLTDFSLENE